MSRFAVTQRSMRSLSPRPITLTGRLLWRPRRPASTSWTTDYLKQHRSQSPRLDAEVLLAQARGCKRIELYTAFDQIADDATRTAFRELVSRRAKGEPVAYLVGKREFFSLSFRVTRDVLIPRPETETLVVRLIDLAKHFATNDQCPRIADVGTGSGIIAICAAKYLPEAKVMAIDSSEMALAVARQNAADHAGVHPSHHDEHLGR